MWSVRPLAVFLLLSATALAQTDARPEFEVASIKPNKSGSNAIGGSGVCSSGGRVSVKNISLDSLIEQAYGIKEFQLLARPNWLASERFDIEAKSGSRNGHDDCKLMVQALLADRCKLLLHAETRQLPVYKLVEGRSGPKLHKVAADAPLGAKIFDISRGQLITRGTSMSQLAEMLAMTGELENLVVDGTGLEGYYEFALEWTPSALAADATPGPSLFTALQEQLGLKLESQKGPVEIFVIDHVEKPSQN
jgi:uncharacterized protein (TIGR03435 family)